MALPREERLKDRNKFKLLFARGKSLSNKILVLYYLPCEVDKRQAGFTAGRKLGKAVVRNRIKRRMQEAYRTLLPNVPKGFVLLFIARSNIHKASFDDIIQGEKELLKRGGIWEEKRS